MIKHRIGTEIPLQLYEFRLRCLSAVLQQLELCGDG
jgi:hypothetical protein